MFMKILFCMVLIFEMVITVINRFIIFDILEKDKFVYFHIKYDFPILVINPYLTLWNS